MTTSGKSAAYLSARARGTRAFVLGVTLLVSGCTALVDRRTVQCSRDEDCASRGDDFAGTVCTTERVCGQESCTRSSDCTRHFGAGAYCRPSDLTCVSMFTEACSEVIPASWSPEAPDPLLIGFMAPLRGEYASYGTPLKQGAQIALERLNGGTEQALAMLVCHDGAASDAKKVATHLVEHVGVSAIVGPAFSGVTTEVVNSVLKPAGVLSISPSATSPDLANWDDQQLFWRTVPSDTYQAPALVRLIDEAVRTLKADGVLGESEKPRVSTVWVGSTWGDGIQLEVEMLLPKAAIVASQKRYEEELGEADWQKTAQEIAGQKPHVIIALGTGEFAKNLLPRIEQETRESPPIYVIPEGGRVSELAQVLIDHAGGTLSSRILGTAPGGRTSESYRFFESWFKGKFANREPGNLAEFAFDAVYLLAYATRRMGMPHPSGREFANTLAQLSCKGQARAVLTPFDRGESWRTAQSGTCLDFEGASGPVDFDGEGEIDGKSSDMQIWCPQEVDGELTLNRILDVFYDASKGELSNDTGEALLSFCGRAL
jgi:branched-chain amino acid transport system substrate-binding protein